VFSFIRFVPNSPRKSQHYIEAAWNLVLPLLRVPSLDVVGGLLLLSWAEFGENSESGLWNYSGLAIRMGLDLGLHKDDYARPEEAGLGLGVGTGLNMGMNMYGVNGSDEGHHEGDDDVCNGKLLFWGLFVLDRILAFGTGRMVTIRDESIEVPLPTQEDLRIATEQVSPPCPFVSIVRLYTLAGKIADILVSCSVYNCLFL
jgi:hypothetical protein